MDTGPFTYQPRCDLPECKGAIYKIAARWNYGSAAELKNYGMACNACLGQRLAEARAKHSVLHLSEGETVGPIGVYRLLPGLRDADLSRLTEAEIAEAIEG